MLERRSKRLCSMNVSRASLSSHEDARSVSLRFYVLLYTSPYPEPNCSSNLNPSSNLNSPAGGGSFPPNIRHSPNVPFHESVRVPDLSPSPNLLRGPASLVCSLLLSPSSSADLAASPWSINYNCLALT